MRSLTVNEANEYLRQVGVEIGDWNQLCYIPKHEGSGDYWINFRAPRDAGQLYCFSRHVAGWLPRGSWKIFQVDNSSHFDRNMNSLYCLLLAGEGRAIEPEKDRTLLFEFDSESNSDKDVELLIANLIFVYLMHENHAYLVSSGSSGGQLLGIQDGFVIFQSRDPGVSGAHSLLAMFESDPLRYPDWLAKILSEDQERMFQETASIGNKPI
jgi:hypothetical protein